MDNTPFGKSEEERELDRLFRESLDKYGALVYAVHQGASISFPEEASVVERWISANIKEVEAHIKRQLQTKASHDAALGLLWALALKKQKEILTQEDFLERLYRLGWYEGIEELADRCGIASHPTVLPVPTGVDAISKLQNT